MTNRVLNKTMIILAGLALLSLGILANGCGGNDGDAQSESIVSDPVFQEPPSLQAKLDDQKARFDEQAPAEMTGDFEAAIAEIRASGILKQALAVGDTAVDFTLPSADGDSVMLSALLADGPVVLNWYRGGWCPYCNLELAALNDIMPQIRQHNAHLVAISPEVPDSAASTAQKNSLDFVVLSDVGNRVADQYGLVYQLSPAVLKHFKGRIDLSAYNADNENQLPLAVTYVVDTDRVIRYAFIDADYKRRAEPAEILSTLAQLSDQARVSD
jgi:peroxiredoxin